MKNSLKTLLLLFTIVLIIPVFAQRKNSLTISAIAANYTGVKDENYDGRKIGRNHLPGPGAEIIYMREIYNGLNIGTGLNYQLGFMGSYINHYERRFKFNDICIPLIIRKHIKIKDFEHLYVTSGVYFGKTTNIKVEYPTSFEWKEWPDYSGLENYSDDIRYSDFYFDCGYHSSLNKRSVFSVAPFFKYRINTTWLNYHQNKFHLGFKFNYSLYF